MPNISRFGGDPNAIKIGGVSAGGIDTTALMTSPLAKDKFRAAIVQSGPARSLLGDPLREEYRDHAGFMQFLPEGPAAEEGLRRAQCEVYMENVNRLARGR